jgi:hypothetical protein
MLNGFELHVYNRCQLYAQLEKTFGLTPQMFADEESHNINSDDLDGESVNNAANESRHSQINPMDVSRHVDNIRKKEAHVIARTWRDLIPVIKLDICTVSNKKFLFNLNSILYLFKDKLVTFAMCFFFFFFREDWYSVIV